MQKNAADCYACVSVIRSPVGETRGWDRLRGEARLDVCDKSSFPVQAFDLPDTQSGEQSRQNHTQD